MKMILHLRAHTCKYTYVSLDYSVTLKPKHKPSCWGTAATGGSDTADQIGSLFQIKILILQITEGC